MITTEVRPQISNQDLTKVRQVEPAPTAPVEAAKPPMTEARLAAVRAQFEGTMSADQAANQLQQAQTDVKEIQRLAQDIIDLKKSA